MSNLHPSVADVNDLLHIAPELSVWNKSAFSASFAGDIYALGAVYYQAENRLPLIDHDQLMLYPTIVDDLTRDPAVARPPLRFIDSCDLATRATIQRKLMTRNLDERIGIKEAIAHRQMRMKQTGLGFFHYFSKIFNS
jgi:hypothetical protein